MRRLLFCLPLVAAQTAAQTAPPDSTLPELSVVATRIPTDAQRLPSHVVVLDRAAIEETGATSVADVLDARAPAQVRRYGPGGIATLSIRGAGSAQTALVLDGHALSDPQLGLVDLTLLPAGLLERVEVLLGAGSALHGAGAIGGVVAIATPAPGDAPSASLASRLGAWGERAVDATASAGNDRTAVLLAGSVLAARDDYPYFDPNAGVSGSVVRREGADRALGSLYLRASHGGRTRLSAAAWLGSAERGAPGAAGTAPDQGARQWDRHARAWADIATPAGTGTLRVGGLVQRAALRYSGIAGDETGNTWLASASAEWSVSAATWTIAAGAGAGLASADHPSLAGYAEEGRGSGWISGSRRFGAAEVFPALRLDAFASPGAGTMAAASPRFGASLATGRGVTLRVSAGTAFRPPTFNDRFWQYADASAPAGDPDLRPERGWTADAGAHLARGLATADVTLFAGATREQIVWLPAEGGLYAPQNLARTTSRGAEASVQLQPVPAGRIRLSAGGAYAFTDARDRSAVGTASYGRPLRYVARHVAKAHGTAATTIGAISLAVSLQARLVGSRPTRADGGAPLPAHGVVDAGARLGRRVGPSRVELGLAIRNLSNTRYSVVEGYPMPPRHATITLRLDI